MPSWDTKLKLGRKLDNVDTATASANQISALLRFDEDGNEEHVSLTIESDVMTADDVAAVFDLLHKRAVLSAGQCRTWLSQPKASKERYGETTEWQGEDLEKKLQLLKHGAPVRAAGGNGAGDGQARLRAALVKVNELERALGELKATMRGQGTDDSAGQD